MKTNRDDVRGTHAAIYSSTNGLVSSPPLPPWIESRSKGRKILSMETRTEENDGKNCSAALWGSYVRTYVSISSTLLSSPRKGSAFFRRTRWDLAKKRRTPIRLRETGISPVLVGRAWRFSFLPRRATLTLFVHTCAPIQRGFFRGTREPERRLGNLGERNESREVGVGGGGGKGRERARVCVQGCIIRVQRNLSGWRGPQQDGKVVSRLWMYFISRYHVGYDFSRGIRWKWKIVRARLTSIFRYLSSGFKFILEMRWIESRNFFLFSSNFYRIALIFNIFRCKIFTYLTIFTYLIYRKKNRDNFDRI